MPAPPIEVTVSSRNPHKLAELRALLEPYGYRLSSAAERGVPEVVEDGETFVDNALLKARAAFQVTGGVCLADDTGLLVDALDGAPGVRSARFAGPHATYADNNRLLLERLEGVPDERRGAAFVTSIVVLVPQPLASRLGAEPGGVSPLERVDLPAGAVGFVAEGRVAGRILRAPRGEEGFGYDPLFLHPPTDLTFAELPADQKNALSHRARAFQALARLLQALSEGGT